MNVISLYHENILVRGGLVNQNIQKDLRFAPYLKFGQIIRLVQNTQVVLEMLMKRNYSKQKTWFGIFGIECLKALIRLYVIFSTKNHVMIEHTALPSEMQLKLELQEMDAEKEVKFKSTFDPLKEETSSPGSRSGKTMPTFDYKVPFLPKRERLYLHQPASTSFLVGEVFHAIRPVVYVGAIIGLGEDSWVPWLVSLGTDLVSSQLSALDASSRGLIVKDEMFRRQSQTMMYLVRSPFFDASFKPGVLWVDEKVKMVPLLGGLFSNIMEYMLTLQTYHFYVNS